MSSAQRNYVPPEEDQEQYPAPLEFFQTDAIHPDNVALMAHEQRRWRLLGFRERLQMRRYVKTLQKELQRGRYNEQARDLHQLARNYRRLKAEYKATAYITPELKREARDRLYALYRRGQVLRSALDEMRTLYEDYQHYSGWLEYEAEYRHELRIEEKRERKIRKEMRREAKWLEQIIIDAWRRAPGCHYTYTDSRGKERTLTPKIAFSIIQPHAHLYYVSASKKVLFGYKLTLPPSVMLPALIDEKVLQNMRAGTKRQVDAIWSETNQLIIRVSRLDSPDAMPSMVRWRDAMNFFPQKNVDRLPYTIGVTDSRRFKWYDFAADPHILVAGKSQSGKSNLVNGIIATLVSTHTPDELRLVLIDMKGGVEMTHWEESPHVLWEVIKTVDEVLPVMKRLVTVMRKRMETYAAVKAKNIADYNRRVDQEHKMARVLLVIDEMNTFVGLKSVTEEIHNQIMLLVSQGRAAGIHVIASTQHPEVAVIPGRIKTNMSIRLSGAMPSVTASQIILDSPEAARLPNVPGRFAVAVGMEELVVQVPYITDEDIQGVVSATRRQYPEVAGELSDTKSMTPLKVWDAQRVLKSSIEWFEGQLSADRLHDHLGSESPGERTLRKLCQALKDEFSVTGALTLTEDGSKWKIKRKGKAYVILPLEDESPVSDESSNADVETPVSELASELVPEPI